MRVISGIQLAELWTMARSSVVCSVARQNWASRAGERSWGTTVLVIKSLSCGGFRRRHVRECWVEQRGQQRPQSTHGALQVHVFSWTKLVGNNSKPPNAEFLMYSYSIFRHLVVFVANFSAALLWLQEPFLLRDQVPSLCRCLFFFCLGWTYADMQSFELKIWAGKSGAAGEDC